MANFRLEAVAKKAKKYCGGIKNIIHRYGRLDEKKKKRLNARVKPNIPIAQATPVDRLLRLKRKARIMAQIVTVEIAVTEFW